MSDDRAFFIHRDDITRDDHRQYLLRSEYTPGGGVWATHTPVLSSSGGTQPNTGSTALHQGRYRNDGTLIVYRAHIVFGGAGIVAGTGNYNISAPTLIDNSAGAYVGGGGYIYDADTDTFKMVVLQRNGSLGIRMFIDGTATAYIVGGTNPWTWATGDFMSIEAIYEPD